MRVDRLQKLIAFLKELDPKSFDFGIVHAEFTCGTVGCAMGWTPVVFDEVQWPKGEHFDLRYNGEDYDYDVFAKKFFELEGRDGVNLFTPHCQQELNPPLTELDTSATPIQVAEMLETYIKLKEEK